MQRLRILTLLLCLAVPGPAGSAAGDKFAPINTMALMPGETTLRPVELGGAALKRPLVICYFLVGEPLGEEMLLELQALALGELKGKIDLYGATRSGRRGSIAETAERFSLLSVSVPVVVEETLALGSALSVTSAPSISLIDAGGVVRITDAKGLAQPVGGGLTLAQAIRNAAAGKPVPTAGKLPRYYPANELIGRKIPDFILREFQGTARVKLSDIVARNNGDQKKVTVLFFWHPNCVHCKKIMPSIVTGFAGYGRYLDIVSVTDLKNSAEERNAADTIRVHKMTFPVLKDEDRRISDMFKVISTPTLFFIKPDGVVDSIYTRTEEISYLAVFSAKIQSILGVAARRPASGSASPSP